MHLMDCLGDFLKALARKVRPAVTALIAKADEVASKLSGSGDDQMNDVFGTEE